MIQEAISKMELQPEEEEVEEFASDSIHQQKLTIVLLTADEVGKVPVVVVKDGFEVFDKFLNNILHHHVIAFVTFLFPQQDLKKICSVILYELVRFQILFVVFENFSVVF